MGVWAGVSSPCAPDHVYGSQASGCKRLAGFTDSSDVGILVYRGLVPNVDLDLLSIDQNWGASAASGGVLPIPLGTIRLSELHGYLKPAPRPNWHRE